MIYPRIGLASDLEVNTIAELAEAYGKFVGVRTNHVMTVDGAFWDSRGSSRGITNSNDLQLLLKLRSLSDLVLVDAKTARLEGYRKPKHASLGVVSRSGDFSGIPAVENGQAGVLLFSAANDLESDSQKFKLDPARPFGDIVTLCNEMGIKSILLEAGPTLTKLAFQEKIVGQSALTVTGYGSEKVTPRNPWDSKAKLLSLAVEPGASYSLWSH
ncbi:MAG: dihydrofolate reductase family protein [Actinomycetota bacterium]